MDPNSGKTKLINRLGREQLQQRLDSETFNRTTLSFYKYVNISNPAAMRDQLFELWWSFNCLGRIYLAHEGVNAQMSVPTHLWNEFEST